MPQGSEAFKKLKHPELEIADRFLDELSASMVLSGSSLAEKADLLEMTIGEMLLIGIRNKINFRVFPSESQFRK